jgi:hypothetical protein
LFFSAGESEGVVGVTGFGGGVVDDEASVSNVPGMCFDEVFGAVAEVCHLEMGVAGELESGGDENGVDFDAGGAGEFEIKFRSLTSLSGTGEDPSAAGEQGSGEKTDEPLGLVGAERSEP